MRWITLLDGPCRELRVGASSFDDGGATVVLWHTSVLTLYERHEYRLAGPDTACWVRHLDTVNIDVIGAPPVAGAGPP
jgi:hypothetical protein